MARIQGRTQIIGGTGGTYEPEVPLEQPIRPIDAVIGGIGLAKTADDTISKVKTNRIQNLKDRQLFGDTTHPSLLYDAGEYAGSSILSTTPDKGYFGNLSKNQSVGNPEKSLLQLQENYHLSENASYKDLSKRLDAVGTLTDIEKKDLLAQYNIRTTGPLLEDIHYDLMQEMQGTEPDLSLNMSEYNNILSDMGPKFQQPDSYYTGPWEDTSAIPDVNPAGFTDSHIFKSLQEKGIIEPGMDYDQGMELVQQHKPHMFPPRQITEMVDNQPILMPGQNIGQPIPYDLNEGWDTLREPGLDSAMQKIPTYAQRSSMSREDWDKKLSESYPDAYNEYRENNPWPAGVESGDIVESNTDIATAAYDADSLNSTNKIIGRNKKGLFGKEEGFGSGSGKISQFGSKFGTGKGAIAGKFKDIKSSATGIKEGFTHLGNIGKGGLKDLGTQIGKSIAQKFGTTAATTAATTSTAAATTAAASAGASAASTGVMAAMGPAGWAMLALSLLGGKIFKPHTFLGKIFSDERLKKNIKYVGKSNSGIPIVHFEYKDEMNIPGRYRGVLSKDVPQARSIHPAYGFDVVDYNMTDVEFKKIN